MDKKLDVLVLIFLRLIHEQCFQVTDSCLWSDDRGGGSDQAGRGLNVGFDDEVDIAAGMTDTGLEVDYW